MRADLGEERFAANDAVVERIDRGREHDLPAALEVLADAVEVAYETDAREVLEPEETVRQHDRIRRTEPGRIGVGVGPVRVGESNRSRVDRRGVGRARVSAVGIGGVRGPARGQRERDERGERNPHAHSIAVNAIESTA